MEDTANRKIRLCEIDYTNVWPITHEFPLRRFHKEVEIVKSVPRELNLGMLRGEIDMGPISSFAYGASFERYVLLPELSVSAYGPVRSILLFYRGSLEDVLYGHIALTTASETSVNLLKIIIEKFYNGRPVYHFAKPSLHDMMKEHDAALLIGDDAIRASWENHGYQYLDLGAEWTRWTGHSMTFAVWAVRREMAERQADLIARIHEAFKESKAKAKADPSRVVAAAVSRIGGDEKYWFSYFNGLTHDFSLTERTGLKQYYDYAVEMGLLPKTVPLNFFHTMRIG